MDKVIDELGLRQYGDYDGNVFIANIDNSDKFSSIYSAISSKYTPDDADTQQFNDTSSVTVFTDDDIEIIASANYDNDLYTISVGEK